MSRLSSKTFIPKPKMIKPRTKFFHLATIRKPSMRISLKKI